MSPLVQWCAWGFALRLIEAHALGGVQQQMRALCVAVERAHGHQFVVSGRQVRSNLQHN